MTLISSYAATNALIQEDVASFDGAIEPLEIRGVVTGLTNPNDVRRRAWGVFEEGNAGDRKSSDAFAFVVRFSDLRLGSYAYLDEADAHGNLSTPSESRTPDARRHPAFHDDQDARGVVVDATLMDSGVLSALRAMAPSSDEVLPATHVQPGASGFAF